MDGSTVALRETTPDAVRFANAEPMGAAPGNHRAVSTDRHRRTFPVAPGPATLTVGVEEQAGICLPAGTFLLPNPYVRHRAG